MIRPVSAAMGLLMCAMGWGPGAAQGADTSPPLTITKTDDGIQVTSGLYSVRLNKARGYTIDRIVDRRARRTFALTPSGLVLVEERERPKYTGVYFGVPERLCQADSPATLGTTRVANGQVRCDVQWKTRVATVDQTIVFTPGTRLIGLTYGIRYTSRLEQAWVRVAVPWFLKDGVFHPEGRRVGGPGRYGHCRPTPAYVFACDRKGTSGLGLVVNGPAGTHALEYGMGGVPEGYPGNAVLMTCHAASLRWRPVPGEVTFGFGLIAGGTPEEARTLFTGGPTSAHIEEVWPTKLILRVGEPGPVRVRVANPTTQAQSMDVALDLVGGIDRVQALGRRTVKLGAGETRALDWAVPGQRHEYGYEVRARLLSGGKPIDTRSEYFAVADRFAKVGQVMVVNPGWCSTEGRETWLIPHLRRNYHGIIEYYCWEPDEIFDLTPDTEQWEPRTESQGSYRATISRTFVKNLVGLAHQHGLRVVSHASGFASLPGALANPRDVKYTSDGQIYCYCGKVYDGTDRFATVVANVYSPDRIRRWADEMCASVKMFGWDGVRFDWNFIPFAAPDPLDLDPKHRNNIYYQARKMEWHDYRGRKASELFPDPDKAAAELCSLWRTCVTRRYPRYQYMINFGYPKLMSRQYPRYFKANTTGAGVLFECRLNVTRKEHNTWQTWARVLAEDTQLVRANGGQPSVGWMRGYAPGGIAQRLIQHIVLSAGVHWYGWAGPRHSIDDTWKRFRYATRFSEYFYDPAFKSLNPPQRDVSVTGAERVLWKPFVYQRQTSERARDVAVHLLNLPKADHIIMHHEVPPPKRNLQVSILLRAGETCRGAWLLRPDPQPRAEKLAINSKAGRLVARVPELVEAGIVVVQLGR